MTPGPVALFGTCLGGVLQARAVRDAQHVLEALGCAVARPSALTCCGQPALTTGHPALAGRMARHTEAALRDHARVVLPSGSCAAMIRSHYPGLDAAHQGWHQQAEDLAGRTWELAEFIVDVLGVSTLGAGLSGVRVALHTGCHARHALAGRRPAATLLGGAGATVVDWEAAEECCGFGGVFAVRMAPISLAMADRKLETLPDVDVVTSGDPGCFLHLSGRAESRGDALRFDPLPSLLRQALDDR